MNVQEVLTFWFQELTPEDWFKSDPGLDEKIKMKFSLLHFRALQMELSPWREDPLGRLAEIIILDQFSRNIYRHSPHAFAQDGAALALAQEMISQKLDQELSVPMRVFVYMPFMHSESLSVHEKGVELFQTPGMEENLDFMFKHKRIIERFGRYPHRNQILGRISTTEELEFLKEKGSSF